MPHTHQGAAGTAARWWALALAALGAALVLLGTGVGSTGLESLWHLLWAQDASAAERALALQIVWDIRLPRTLGAWAAGALLGLAGAVAQGLFRNPLADPYLLGSASGASLGVAAVLALMGSVGFLGTGRGALAASVYSGQWLEYTDTAMAALAPPTMPAPPPMSASTVATPSDAPEALPSR